MAKIYTVSLSEKELISWLEDRRVDNSISPSLVFRDAMKEKKQEWDMIHSENPKTLHLRINGLKKQVSRFSEFMEENPKAQEDYFKFIEKKDKGAKVIKSHISQIRPNISKKITPEVITK